MALTIGSGTFTNGSTSVKGVTFTSGGASFISSGTLLGVGVSPMDRQVEAISATTNTITLREAWGGTTGAKQFTAAYTTEGLRDAVDAARGFSEQLANRSTATTTDMQTATNDVKIATPLKVKQAIDFHAYNKAAANAEFVSRSDIVGTVSQSGGYPTGSVFESGSGPNGEYTKYADGTLQFSGMGTLSVNNASNGNSTITLPVTPFGDYEIAPSKTSAGLPTYSISRISKSTNSITVYVWNFFEQQLNTGTCDIAYIGYGRWY